MRRAGRMAGRLLVVLAATAAALWWFGPHERVDLNPGFDPRKFGEGVQVYFESVESVHDNITPGTEKRVIWQPGAHEQRTAYAVLYLHGFSATSEEIRPVPDRVADALGANLVFARLTGHGRGPGAMSAGNASAWMADTAEALAAARAVGDTVVVIATSTGATLAAAAALNDELNRDVGAMILISPNFGINDSAAWVLSLPAARHWLPLVMGDSRSFTPANDAQARYWTTTYAWPPVTSMAALVRRVAALDFSGATIPVLFRFSDADTVVRADISHHVAGLWGGPAQVQLVSIGPGDDPAAHVIAGDILSPGQTDAAVNDILAWLGQHGIR